MRSENSLWMPGIKKTKKFVYTVDIKLDNESRILKKVHDKNIMLTAEKEYHFPTPGSETLSHRPVVIGSGPAGLFCAWYLAKAGYCPLVLERGEEADKRQETVENFWKNGILDPNSNVQFGEGGAGTFSDGKLNTLVKTPMEEEKKFFPDLWKQGLHLKSFTSRNLILVRINL